MKTIISCRIEDRAALERQLKAQYPNWKFEYAAGINLYILKHRFQEHTIAVSTDEVIVNSRIRENSWFFWPWFLSLGFLFTFLEKRFGKDASNLQEFGVLILFMVVGYGMLYLNPFLKKSIKDNHESMVQLIEQQNTVSINN